jgi:mono/diheme cytochrome c family protein
MNRRFLVLMLLFVAGLVGCGRRVQAPSGPQPTAFGAALVEVGGGKQVAQTGAALEQPVVVQVNDAQGNAVTGAAVQFRGPAGVLFNPSAALTDSSGQVSTMVSLGGVAGRYQLTAATRDNTGKLVELKLQEIALGYQQTAGRELNRRYCSRCHDPESTPERVSNYDNLLTKPHAFTEGDTLNKMSDGDLVAIISHGGPALGNSPEMPPYGYTLSKSDIQALVSYIRAVADPPYQSAGVVYAKNSRVVWSAYAADRCRGRAGALAHGGFRSRPAKFAAALHGRVAGSCLRHPGPQVSLPVLFQPRAGHRLGKAAAD